MTELGLCTFLLPVCKIEMKSATFMKMETLSKLIFSYCDV